MLRKLIPAEKNNKKQPVRTGGDVAQEEEHPEFWDKLEKIDGLDLAAGLNRAAGQRDLFIKTLKLTMQEIEKSDKNLVKLLSAEDMEYFGVEVHGMKGVLAVIGAQELSAKALNLEIASDKPDLAFCILNLPVFLSGLSELYRALKDTFSVLAYDDSPTEIPTELPGIFEKLMNAFDELDLMIIDQEIENIDALCLSGKLSEEVEQIKNTVMMMDYTGAVESIQQLLSSAR